MNNSSRINRNHSEDGEIAEEGEINLSTAGRTPPPFRGGRGRFRGGRFRGRGGRFEPRRGSSYNANFRGRPSDPRFHRGRGRGFDGRFDGGRGGFEGGKGGFGDRQQSGSFPPPIETTSGGGRGFGDQQSGRGGFEGRGGEGFEHGREGGFEDGPGFSHQEPGRGGFGDQQSGGFQPVEHSFENRGGGNFGDRPGFGEGPRPGFLQLDRQASSGFHDGPRPGPPVHYDGHGYENKGYDQGYDQHQQQGSNFNEYPPEGPPSAFPSEIRPPQPFDNRFGHEDPRHRPFEGQQHGGRRPSSDAFQLEQSPPPTIIDGPRFKQPDHHHRLPINDYPQNSEGFDGIRPNDGPIPPPPPPHHHPGEFSDRPGGGFHHQVPPPPDDPRRPIESTQYPDDPRSRPHNTDFGGTDAGARFADRPPSVEQTNFQQGPNFANDLRPRDFPPQDGRPFGRPGFAPEPAPRRQSSEPVMGGPRLDGDGSRSWAMGDSERGPPPRPEFSELSQQRLADLPPNDNNNAFPLRSPDFGARRNSDFGFRGGRGRGRDFFRSRSSPRGGRGRGGIPRPSSVRSNDEEFARSRTWGSSQSSPQDRKPSFKFFQAGKDADEASQPFPSVPVVPPPLSTSTKPAILPPPPPPPVSAASTQASASVPVGDGKPPPLLTSTLGDKHVDRSEKVVSYVSDVLESADFKTAKLSKLPSKQQILVAVGKMDAQIKAAQKEAEEKKLLAEEAEEKEKVERVKQKEEAEARAKRESEARIRAEEEKRTEDEQVHEAEIQVYIDEQQALFETKQGKTSNELTEKLRVAKDEEEKKMRENLNEQMIATADNFDKDIAKARKDHDRATTLVKKTTTRLSNAEKDYRAKLQKIEKKVKSTEEALDPCDFVSSIIAENRKRAAEAHMKSLSLVSMDDSDNDTMTEELENARDPKHDRTTAEWIQLTRQVTGFDNALYTEPCDAPYFEVHERNHQIIAPLVEEFISDKQNRLNQHWTKLAEEYEYRTQLYKKQQHLALYGQGNNKKKHAVSIHHSILTNTTTSKPVQATVPGTTGPRVSSNPYRRARRGNEVRSEYEQEQIIAEIAAKEALEERITFGGCEMPRQIGRLERQLEGEFVNTFTAQKIDIMEQELEQKNTNVWSDMEKAIFLDRFMQFPKDFKAIARYLRNKTTKDCVRFYYDSKQSVPYKGALREHVMRRKRRGDYQVWNATIEAALSVGAIVEAGVSEEKPVEIHLPEDDHTYKTRLFHPMQREVFDAMNIDEAVAARFEGEEKKKSGRKRRHKDPLFTLDPEQAKYLKANDSGGKLEKSPSRSSMTETEDSYIDSKDESVPTRKTPQKWTSQEKKIFLETLEKHGRNWAMLSEAVGTKTISQIKNFYYDYKKQQGRGRGDKKSGRRSDRSASGTPPPIVSNRMPETPASDAASYPDAVALAREQAHLASLYERHSNQHSVRQYQSNDMYGLHQEASEHGLSHSGTSTPDPMELYVQAHQQALLQQNQQLLNEETVRRLLQQQSHAQQHQQILASLLPWVNGGLSSHSTAAALQNEWNDTHQLQSLLQQHSHSGHLATLGLSGLGGHGLGSSSQHHHSVHHHHHQQRQQQNDEAQHLALARHLLNLQSTGSSSSTADAMNLLIRSLTDRGGNRGNGNPPL